MTGIPLFMAAFFVEHNQELFSRSSFSFPASHNLSNKDYWKLSFFSLIWILPYPHQVKGYAIVISLLLRLLLSSL